MWLSEDVCVMCDDEKVVLSEVVEKKYDDVVVVK